MSLGQAMAVANEWERLKDHEPNLVTIHIERLVSGYIVEVGEKHSCVEYVTGATCRRGPRHLVTSHGKLIELLTAVAPQPLDKPALESWSGKPIEEKKW